jgi:hypothetical protein
VRVSYPALLFVAAVLLANCSGGSSSGPQTPGAPRNSPTPAPSGSASARPTGGPSATPSATATPTAIASGSSRTFPDTTDGIFVYSDQLDTSSASEAQFQFAATHFVGSQKLLPGDAAHLRTYNSNFLVLHYRLGLALGYRSPSSGCAPTGSYLQIIDGSWVQEWPGDSVVNASWFFQYGGSARVYNCSWGWYLMELNDPGWRAWWSGQVMGQLALNQDDGVFADSYSIPNYLGPYNPALPAVDATFESSWATRMHSFTDYMRTQFAGRWLWIPNVGSWITTRDPSDYSNVDGAMLEGFAEGGNENYYALGDWQLQMNRALSLVNAGKIVIGQTYPNGSDANERLFVLGTYLLIKGHHTYVNLDSYGLAIQWQPEYGINLGAPVDPVPANISTLLNASWNLYVRHYANGMVLVNPSPADNGALALGGTFYQALPTTGGPVPSSGMPPGSVSYSPVTSVDVCPHCAAILLNASP